MLFDDELAAQRDHEEDTEPSAKQGEGEDAGGFEVEAEEDERGQGEDDAGGDGLAGVAGGLDDVVLEDAALPNARNMEIERTEMGMEAATVRPARRPT